MTSRCYTCNGRGSIDVAAGNDIREQPCLTCHGTCIVDMELSIYRLVGGWSWSWSHDGLLRRTGWTAATGREAAEREAEYQLTERAGTK